MRPLSPRRRRAERARGGRRGSAGSAAGSPLPGGRESQPLYADRHGTYFFGFGTVVHSTKLPWKCSETWMSPARGSRSASNGDVQPGGMRARRLQRVEQLGASVGNFVYKIRHPPCFDDLRTRRHQKSQQLLAIR